MESRLESTVFMTDFSEAEISALELCFPDSTVYLCDFHREQAWERWVHDKSHNLSVQDSELLLDHLRACAWAPSADSNTTPQQDHHFQESVEVLKSTNVWKNNAHVHQCISNTWLNSSKVCL